MIEFIMESLKVFNVCTLWAAQLLKNKTSQECCSLGVNELKKVSTWPQLVTSYAERKNCFRKQSAFTSIIHQQKS